MDAGSRPLVSVITPSLNQAPFILDTLRSVGDQDYPHIQHIVMDGGSSDGSMELVREWSESHPIQWYSGPDGGQGDAIQRGVAIATGSIVAWLNSDDIYLDNQVIADVVNLFDDPDVQAVTGGGWYISADGGRLRPIPVRPDRIDYRTLRCVDWILQPATFVRRETLLRYPIDTGLHWAFDWDLFIRMSRDLRFTPLSRDIAGYRIHGTGKTVSGAGRRQQELLEVTGRYNSRFSARYGLLLLVAKAHQMAERLPTRMYRAVGWFLDRIAVLSQNLTNGRGIQY